MKILTLAQKWIQEFRPEWVFKRINGSNSVVNIIIENNGNYELIEFSILNGRLVTKIEEYNLCEKQ
jgi:hypothetical protein